MSADAATTEATAAARSGHRKVREGLVVSDKMDKTVVVTVEVYRRHPLYGRLIRRTRKFKAHDALNTCHAGDRVEIRESRPLSKDKRWTVAAVLQRGEVLVVPEVVIPPSKVEKPNERAEAAATEPAEEGASQ